MTAAYLDGREVAQELNARTAREIDAMRASGVIPGLGTIQVGDDPTSSGYVRKKHELCNELGVDSFHRQVRIEEGQAGLLRAVDDFNAREQVDAFLIQYPVPDGFDFNEAVMRVQPGKDIDGLHPVNLGMLVLQKPGMVPCTPAAVVSGGITWEGRRLLPDVDESVAEVAGWITPRLGGLGPVTLAMLMRNAAQAAKRRLPDGSMG